MSEFEHFACIDWSGALGERHAGIKVALCSSGNAVPSLIRPGHRWSRQEALAWLQNELPSATLVGVDLGTSLPFIDQGAYFPGWPQSPEDTPALWAMIEKISAQDPHFTAASFVDHPDICRHFRRHGGRTGELFTAGRGRLRQTELAQADMGLNPYSNFNLVGAAQVGKSSLTGMRVLHRLRGKLPVWPFDRDARSENGSLLVEIYTSIAALEAGRRPGRSKMRTIEELNQALISSAVASRPYPGSGLIDDHSSDALLTAAWLRHAASRQELWHPKDMTDEIANKEGWTFGAHWR